MKIVISIETFAVLLNICPEKFLSFKKITDQECYWQENKILTSAALLAQTPLSAFH